MRTLKKSLALVLVLAMMFSLAVTASADFTDAEEIAYPDEVELLVALDIIEGYEDGSFQPTKTLTRAEAAVIAARLNAYFDETSATTSYTDMAGYGWAEWAVSYCENEGIVNGVGAGKFEPATTLTGYMWVKMVLVSMGYDAEEYGMTGAAWQVGVAKLYKTVLDYAAGLDLSAEITREEACAVAYAALLATRDGAEYAVEHYTSEEGYHFHFFTSEEEALTFAAAIDGEIYTGEFVTSLGFEKHGLIEYTIGFGQWGEPYFGWETVNGFITKTWIDPSVEIYTAVTDGELFELATEAGLYYNEFENTEDYVEIFNLFINGEYVEGEKYEIYKGLYDYVVPFSGNGTRLALYDAGMYGIIGVAVEQFIGVVAEVAPANPVTGADPYVIIVNLCDDDDADEIGFTLYNFSAELGDVVLYNVCADEFVNIHAPATVSGLVEEIDMKNTRQQYDDVYTLSGVEYIVSRHDCLETEGGDNAVYYVDDCGNLMMKAYDIPFTYEIGVLLSYDAENYYKGDEMHTCEEYFASEKFEIYNITTGETVVYDGVVTSTAAKTTYTMGYSVTNETPWTGDALDLANVPYDVKNAADLSLGLVVYLVNEDGEIFYISDTVAGNGSLIIANAVEELVVDPFDVNLYDGRNYAGLQLDGTEYVYGILETTELTAVATGIKNADALSAKGEYMVDVYGNVVAVAQYTPAPVEEDAEPVVTTEYVQVYVGGDFTKTLREFYTVDEYGNLHYDCEWVVTGLYVDGVAIGTKTFSEDPWYFFIGNLYQVGITYVDGVETKWAVEEAWDAVDVEIEYIGSGAAGEYFLTETHQYHLAEGANIVIIDEATKSLTVVDSLSALDITYGRVHIRYALSVDGLITDLYVVVYNTLLD